MPDVPTPPPSAVHGERADSARLDNFVDGAFAFAITLLIISGGGLPHDVAALEHALRGVPAFAACFALLAFFWHGHVRWRDSVCRTDGTSLRLSLLLVFFALIFVFPLHLVFAGLFSGFSEGVLSPDYHATIVRTSGDVRALFVCYGVAFACMAGTLALLCRHGVRAGAPANRTDAITLRVWTVLWAFFTLVGALSMVLALALPVRNGWLDGLPGFSYFLLSLTGPIAHIYSKRLKARLPE